jgi:integrase
MNMFSKTPTGKASKGNVSVSSDKGRLRLSFPREMFGGKQKFLYLSLTDNPENRPIAEAKATQVNLDIFSGEFDITLNKYKPQTHLALIETLKAKPEITLLELWDKYTAYKQTSLKPKTLEKYENIRKLLEKIKVPLGNSIEVKSHLEDITTTSRTKDVLMYLSAICKWGVKHGLCKENPYEGMSAEMPHHNYQDNPSPSSFTQEEMETVINSFKNDKRPGMNYKRYAAFVEFLFLTGCRPSEAVGLQWKHIKQNGSVVEFAGSIVQVKNQRVRVAKSKNNKVRTLAVSSRCQNLLQTIKPIECSPEDLIFSVNNQPVNYRNFSRRAWSAIVDPIKPNTTPYNARDTFITLQLIKGIPSAVVANWCDTSVGMIDKNYADKLKLSALRPID